MFLKFECILQAVVKETLLLQVERTGLSCCMGLGGGGLWAVLDRSLGGRWRLLAIPVGTADSKSHSGESVNLDLSREFSLTPESPGLELLSSEMVITLYNYLLFGNFTSVLERREIFWR